MRNATRKAGAQLVGDVDEGDAGPKVGPGGDGRIRVDQTRIELDGSPATNSASWRRAEEQCGERRLLLLVLDDRAR